MNLIEIQDLVFEEYKKNKYLEMWQSEKGTYSQEQKIKDLAELGLIITEISESMEEIRKKDYVFHDLAIECSDIIIRVLNFMSRKNLDAEYFILLKNEVNTKREKLHGKGV